MTAQITYEPRAKSVAVRIDGKPAGAIHPHTYGGFQYRRTSTIWGERFATVAEVKRSIEGDDA